MRLPWFLRFHLPRRTPADNPEDMHLWARIDALEADMQSVRSSINSTHSSMRRMSGKVYRGVQLGDTVNAEPEPPTDAEINAEPNGIEYANSKAALYTAAEHLRRR